MTGRRRAARRPSEPDPGDTPRWTPSPARRAASRMVDFARVARSFGAPQTVLSDGALDYAALHAWSVARRDRFWQAVWQYSGVIADIGADDRYPGTAGIGLDRMAPPDAEHGPRWFPGTRLNFAENLLRFSDAHPALVSWTERGPLRSLTYEELGREVARVAAALRLHGVVAGDRVAGWMPNIPETVIAMLGAASLGAVWSSCSPDFGVSAVEDRFGQIEPRVLFIADGYLNRGTVHDCMARAREIVERIPAIERVVVVPHRARVAPDDAPARAAELPRGVLWDDFLGPPAGPDFLRLPFDHPVYIMYSSGTTGLPKCMVHGAGGTLLQHQKEHLLHTDLRRDDCLFYFTTCGWMMWNWLVSALAVGATVALYDGSPMAPAVDILWQLAERERITVFGTSAKYLALAEKAAVAPATTRDLSALRMILSTGSPLAAHSFDYVYAHIKPDVHLASISGGTDIISCFVLGNPAAPVWRGEMQAAGLGMALEIRDESGAVMTTGPGELVCSHPFPSMPTRFWNDPGSALYRAAYFERFPGVWRHGDWIEHTVHDGWIILGRSDATLNPGGIRIGTAEIYRQVEQLDEVVESIAVAQETSEGPGDVRIVLFVRLREPLVLNDGLRQRIRQRVREHASPHHVPSLIVQVPDIPRTISGKISEIAVRDVIHGRNPTNVDALANPEALAFFRDHPELGQ